MIYQDIRDLHLPEYQVGIPDLLDIGDSYLVSVDLILGIEPVIDLVILNTAPSPVPGS